MMFGVVRRILPPLLIALFAGGAVAQPTSKVVLNATLAKWRDEIEALGRRKVILARVYVNTANGHVYLPADTEDRQALLPYFRTTSFLRQLLASDALNVNVSSDQEELHFILLNMSREAAWNGGEDAVIAKELGHAWLFAKQYAAPSYEGKEDSCLASLTTDVLQDPMIRKLMREREIDYDAYWIPQLERALRLLEHTPVRPVEQIETCALISKLVLWLDVKNGLTDRQWADRGRFLAELNQHYPLLRRTVNDLDRKLAGKDLFAQKVYGPLLQETLYTIYGLVQTVLGRTP